MLIRNLIFIAALLALAALLLAALMGYAVHREVNHQDCGLRMHQAKTKVEKDLLRRGLPVVHLVHEQSRGTCLHFFGYKNEDHHFSYSVQSTWLHGVKVGRYDYSSENRASH